MKKLFGTAGPSSTSEDDDEVIRIDEDGFFRSSHITRTMQWRQSWGWDEITGFGFVFSPALFPDPWFGDYMEGAWFFTVSGEAGPENIHFDARWLDIEHLPPALLRHMPGLELDVLREGVCAAAGGTRNYAGEGRWIGWQRPLPAPKRRKPRATGPATGTRKRKPRPTGK
ncbi:MAG: hypothetical protein ACRECY_13395 [Phyllobacterium sp.]